MIQNNQQLILKCLEKLTPDNSNADETPDITEAPTLTPPQHEVCQPPTALPIEGMNPTNSLPSSEINKSTLRPVEHVLRHHQHSTITNAGKLASQLAMECVFGVEIRDAHPLVLESLVAFQCKISTGSNSSCSNDSLNFGATLPALKVCGKSVSRQWNIVAVVCTAR